MTRAKMIHKLLYGGVVVLCLVSCWNARLLYTATDDKQPAKHAEFVKQVIGQRDTLFDTVNILKQKCASSNDRSHVPARNASCGMTPLWTKPNEEALKKALVLGYERNEPGFLTVGIPTVERKSELYLTQTLDSLIDNSTPEQRSDVVLLLFLADLDEEKRNILKNMMMDKYLSHLESGFIQVIQAPSGFYPPLGNLKLKYGDSKERVYWRSKQCVDFAFMFFYAESLSKYYIQIEDDVITTPGYITAIQQFVQLKSNIDWVTLEFSVLGFIGKLFHAYDLDRLAQFVMFFYQDQPVDFLYRYFNSVNGQQETYLRVPSLFQHKGKQSSLKEKEMDMEDNFFEPDHRKYTDSDNPPGKVYSDMKPFSMYLPQLSYSPEPGFFWAGSPKEGQSVILVFNLPTLLSRVAIATGSDKHPADMLEEAAVELSSKVLHKGNEGSLPECSDYVEVGRFLKGEIDVNVREKFTEAVACLRIHVLKSQVQWAVIREIAVWLPH
ncbi:alpha-1,3-mannosyl-glycoprotein 4-beta-N-acetylglucosaminyltransferase C [Strongylocentrotus purpuratus]|uniref:Alpha-1,3-mannosyl-glycoprotein 4-beta-N-acetylglucosaminyltransferase C-like n=1 Tax=Strongylocentrotus purpuratus TaxID=7668 RepID=A0A7M7T0S6_STRPU|nr:alpha-1,3-mannosyl-glycoprotein 4-beta-N-acetylglucosaminyltransferase C [Strongylocentrotus purpuratus]